MSLTSDQVVEVSDGVFSGFDAMAERRQLEKIKTVGDAYTVVAGLPEPRSDAAEAVLEMAVSPCRTY